MNDYQEFVKEYSGFSKRYEDILNDIFHHDRLISAYRINVNPAKTKQSQGAKKPEADLVEKVLRNTKYRLQSNRNKTELSEHPDRLVSLYEMILNSMIVIKQDTNINIPQETSEKIDNLSKDVSKKVKEINSVVYGIELDKENPCSMFMEAENPFNSLASQLNYISTEGSIGKRILGYINHVFIGILVTYINNSIIEEDDYNKFVVAVQEKIKSDSIILNMFTDRFRIDISGITNLNRNQIFQFVYERDINFWKDVLFSLKDKNLILSVNPINYIFQLNPIRNLCSHIGLVEPAKEWLYLAIAIIIEFADNIGYYGYAAEIRKRLIFEKQKSCPLTNRGHYIIPPRNYRDVDYSFLLLSTDADDVKWTCWKNEVEYNPVTIKIDKDSNLTEVFHKFFADSECRKKAARRMWSYYRDRIVLFDSNLVPNDFEATFIECYPFHPYYINLLSKLEIDSESILEIAFASIEKAYSNSNYHHCLIMPFEIDLDHPAITEKLTKYFNIVTGDNLDWRSNHPSPLGWQFIKYNYIQENTEVVEKYMRAFGFISPATELSKLLLLYSISKELSCSREDLRFCLLQPGMLVQNVEKALKEMKYFWGELLFENSEWEVGIKRLTDFSFVLDLFTHEDKEIPDEEVGSELYLIIGDIVNEQEYFGENISKLKSEIMLVKKLKLYLNAIWAYDTDRRINNYDECERILAN